MSARRRCSGATQVIRRHQPIYRRDREIQKHHTRAQCLAFEAAKMIGMHGNTARALPSGACIDIRVIRNVRRRPVASHDLFFWHRLVVWANLLRPLDGPRTAR